jgi:hypothetical protein
LKQRVRPSGFCKQKRAPVESGTTALNTLA